MAAATPLDWQTGKTLLECFDYLLTSGTASDVTFVVGEEKKRFFVHKLVLISRSPVFYAMLEGPMAEKGGITIPDISEETFRLFLRYLYTDTINLTEDNVVPVLSAARKYCVDILVSRCEEFLNKTLSVGNACLFLEHAHVFVMANLKNDCLRLIDDSPIDTLQSATFADLCPSCVTSITESEDLYAAENDVYKAVIMWAEAECKRYDLEITPNNNRKVLGDILYTVRFPVMEYIFFQKEVCHDKILPGEDVVQIINYQHHQEKVSGSKLNYNERIANSAPHKLWRVDGIVHNIYDPGTDGLIIVIGCESVSFSASDSVQLHGFGSYYSYGDNTVNVVIYENDKVLYKADKMSLVESKSDDIGEVLLTDREPIHIKPGNVYTITEDKYCSRKCYGEQLCTQPMKLNRTTITFRDIHHNLRDQHRFGRHNGRQVPYLLLKTV